MNERDWTLYYLSYPKNYQNCKIYGEKCSSEHIQMTTIRFLDIVINDMILSEMQRNSFYSEMFVKMYMLEYKIETTVFIKFHRTGAVNVYTDVFIFS